MKVIFIFLYLLLFIIFSSISIGIHQNAYSQFNKYDSRTQLEGGAAGSEAGTGMIDPNTGAPIGQSYVPGSDGDEDMDMGGGYPGGDMGEGDYSGGDLSPDRSGIDSDGGAGGKTGGKNGKNGKRGRLNGVGGISDDDDSQGNVFGRGTGINDAKSGKKKKEFVTLNPETAFGPEVITSFDHPNVEILDLTKFMQKLTGLNLIYEKDIKGKISIVAPTPITVGDAWKAYLIALNINGFTMVKAGAFYKITRIQNIRNMPAKIYMGNYTPNTENYVMRIVPLKNVSSAEITRSFRTFMSQYGRIIEIRQTNTVILHDTGANINRLVKLMKFLDVPGHDNTLHIFKIENSSASEIVNLLDRILKSQNAGSRFGGGGDLPTGGRPQSYDASKLVAESRTNSIIAMTNEEGAKQLQTLIKKLDVKIDSNGAGQIQVYYLNYGDSENLAKTLSSLVSTAGPGGPVRFTRSPGELPPLFSSAVKITSDKANNALVVMASPTDYLTIRNIISKLDVPRDQVYVEGLIMEAQVSSGTTFGISIIGAYGSGSAQKIISSPAGTADLLSLLTNNITSLSGLFIGGGGGKEVEITSGGNKMKINTVNALIKAIANDSSTNVLATPQLLVMDNEEGVFEAGETVPTLRRENAANGSTTTSVQDQKVALTLKITPQINKVTHMVKLKINQKVDDFSGRNTGISEGAATTTRVAQTVVLVRDKDTIAMGGLMRDKNIETESKVPLLGDIPVLGWLFKQKTKSTEKVNLLFFLTPRILASYEKDTAQTTKDVLSRRNAHLYKVMGDNDPMASTVKALYKKAEQQEKGPLYDTKSSSRFIEENKKGSGDDSNNNSNSNDRNANDRNANDGNVINSNSNTSTSSPFSPEINKNDMNKDRNNEVNDMNKDVKVNTDVNKDVNKDTNKDTRNRFRRNKSSRVKDSNVSTDVGGSVDVVEPVQPQPTATTSEPTKPVEPAKDDKGNTENKESKEKEKEKDRNAVMNGDILSSVSTVEDVPEYKKIAADSASKRQTK
ncbi:MAG: type II secretion system secretin GspD [Oligoflexia bacterium]|nr:type II secretion system secretin GspD [Oligoflexia bacterium]